MAETTGVWSNYMLLSKECGTFDGIEFAPEFEKHNLLEVHCLSLIHIYTDGMQQHDNLAQLSEIPVCPST